LNLRIREHKSKMELVYETLKTAITSGEWKIGERRNAIEIAKVLGVSRTPVIEASRLLEMEGLLRVLPQVGLEVPILTSEEQEEVFLIRGALSGLAAARACRFLDEKDLIKLETITQSMDSFAKEGNSEEFFKLNREFHQILFRNCRLPHVIMLLQRYWNNGNRYAPFFGQVPGIMDTVAQNHHRIISALKSRNENEAKAAAERNCFEFGAALADYLRALDTIAVS
jgi:DNA-binding GntR family transcriptional regulator